MVKSFGQLESWDDEPESGNFSGNDFLYLNKDGEYPMRVITRPPYKFYMHWADAVDGTRTRVNCAMDDCILCKEAGDDKQKQAQRLFLAIVLDRRDNQPKILEFKKSVYDDFRKYERKPHWGNLNDYDVEIERDVSRGPKTYSVTPLGKSELTPQEVEQIKAFQNRTNLSRLCDPSTNEIILKKLGRSEGESMADVPSVAETPVVSDTTTPVQQQSTASVQTDPDFDF